MADEMGEKTEEPTPRRRQEARDEGNVAKSQDLTGGIVLLGAVLLLAAFGTRMLSSMMILLRSMLSSAGTADITRPGDLGALWATGMDLAYRMLAPVAIGVAVCAVIAGVLQVGFLVTGKSIQPKLSKVSPVNGLKQLFGMRGLVRFIMSLGKVTVVLGVAWISIYNDLPQIMSLIQLEAGPLLAAASGLVWSLAIKIAIVLLILGVLDYLYQKWQHEEDMKMTKQEVKEEHKRMEGDPLVKQRRSKVAKQLAMQRLNHDVPDADVVVTNPTHYAVALKYDAAEMKAPRVVAKGADHLAIRVRQIAAAHGVPLVERPPLARGMYRTVEVGDEIPPEFYNAVAEIMAYVYKLSGKKSA